MTPRGSVPSADPYSPQRRTALLLSGTGTMGAYHAGVLRALREAGVKIDLVAGRGAGAIGALFAAVDGSQRLWDDRGFWRARAAARLYMWHPVLRVLVAAIAAAIALVALPLVAMAAGLVVFPIDFALKMVGVSSANGLAEWYLALAARAFAPEGLPTWLPRLVVLVLATAAGAALVIAWQSRDPRRTRGGAWWRIIRAPLSPAVAVDHVWSTAWDLIRGAAQLRRPAALEIGRRYVDLLSENLGQPGFCELVIATHDLDAGRDLIFALVSEPRRMELVRRMTTAEADERRASVVDLAGVGRDHLVDAIGASLCVPLATDPHRIAFAPDAYWRGETHRLCDRPESIVRVFEELVQLGVEQFIVVTAAPQSSRPHALAPARLDGKGRIGEYLQSAEAAAIGDLVRSAIAAERRVFVISPAHNPIGPLDFGEGFDDRSDRTQPVPELMLRGYEDAYRLFIEPVVGASGERVASRRASISS